MRTHSNRIVRTLGCLLSLVAIGCSETPVGELAADLSDTDSNVRYTAVKKLEDHGPAAYEAVAELGTALGDPNPKIRYRSAKTLSKMDMGARDVIEKVAAALKKADGETRYYLVKTLANVEEAAVIALDDLQNILQKDPDPRIRYYAAKSLGRIGKQARSAAPALKAALKDRDERTRNAAEDAFAKVTAP